MEKITLIVSRDNAINAMATAYEYAKFYRPNRKPDVPMIMDEIYIVHHTKNKGIVIKQKTV